MAADAATIIAAAVEAQIGERLDAIERAVADVARHGGGAAPLMTRHYTAQWASCSLRTVDGWLADGCPHVRLGGPGGSPRFIASEVVGWLRARGGRGDSGLHVVRGGVAP